MKATAGENINTPSHGVPSTIDLVAYAAPVGAMIFLWMPTMSILPGLYAKYFGLKLTAIAVALLVTRLLDGITDPAIGFFADRHRAAGGSYKSWIVAGGICLAVAAYFLFSPPPHVSQVYFLSWLLVFYIGWTLMDIPHAAWGATLAGDYHGRARVYSFRTTSIFCGLIVFFAVPFLPLLASREFTPETMKWAAYAGAAVMSICLAVMSWAPKGEIMQARGRDSPRAVIRSIISNKPLLLFLATYFAGGIGYGMWFGLVFLYLDGYLHLGDKISVIFLLGNVAGMVSMPFWLKLIRKTSKSTAWAIGIALYTSLLCGCMLVKPATYWWVSLLLTGGVYVSFACQTMATQAILGDIVDYGLLKFRCNRGATYFALLTLSYKVTSGLGAGIALGVAGYFGFDGATATQSKTGIFGLRLAFIFIPVVCAVIALPLTLLTPITKTRHRIIRHRIDTRSE